MVAGVPVWRELTPITTECRDGKLSLFSRSCLTLDVGCNVPRFLMAQEASGRERHVGLDESCKCRGSLGCPGTGSKRMRAPQRRSKVDAALVATLPVAAVAEVALLQENAASAIGVADELANLGEAFGIAKATNTELTQKTLVHPAPASGRDAGVYVARAGGNDGLDVDTRSDIYSLGVLLYDLLTGTTPFDTETLREAGFGEMLRIIREEEPHTPSTRLSSLGDTATRTAERRCTDVKKLGLLLRGDLDWIVMKCLEKDRTRRYETVNDLAADIRRHLDDEPVAAGPPSRRYRIRKFVSRNRVAVLCGLAIASALSHRPCRHNVWSAGCQRPASARR